MDTAIQASTPRKTWRSAQAYALAIVCLGLGIGLGYLGRGRVEVPAPVQTGGPTGTQISSARGAGSDMPSLSQLKFMADKKAEPLLDQLKTDPNNAKVLGDVAHIYVLAHQFKEAIPYYERSLKADPKNVGMRADFASCLFYSGDADKAIETLEEALRYDPKSAQALFNLGMIRWQAKGDSAGAIVLWQRLLKTNPNLPSDRRQAVEKAIADARKGARPTGG